MRVQPDSPLEMLAFTRKFCHHCIHDRYDHLLEACPILIAGLKRQAPEQWQFVDGQPTCTNFRRLKRAPMYPPSPKSRKTAMSLNGVEA